MPNPKILNIDDIFEEKGNRFSRFERVEWPDIKGEFLDIRRYEMNKENEEVALKGFTFLTEEGPGNLAVAILKNNFGDTEEIISAICDREDFSSSLNNVVGEDSPHYDPSIPKEEFYDAAEFINE